MRRSEQKSCSITSPECTEPMIRRCGRRHQAHVGVHRGNTVSS